MKFVYNQPAIVIGKNLLVADVHVGAEFELQQKGVLIPLQHKETAEKINAILEETNCDTLYILGDVKHDFFGAKDREIRMLNSFFHSINAKSIVIKGNHDAEVEKISGVKTVEPQGLLLKHGGVSYLLVHGHCYPQEKDFEKADWIIMGHHHPMVEIKESEGFTWRERAWIIGEFQQPAKKFAIIPAFGELAGGIAFNTAEPMGPFFARHGLNKNKTQAVLLNGVKLGSLESLETGNKKRKSKKALRQ